MLNKVKWHSDKVTFLNKGQLLAINDFQNVVNNPIDTHAPETKNKPGTNSYIGSTPQ